MCVHHGTPDLVSTSQLPTLCALGTIACLTTDADSLPAPLMVCGLPSWRPEPMLES
jgi:hypothetical protein